jgi:uncharacterized membrane protein
MLTETLATFHFSRPLCLAALLLCVPVCLATWGSLAGGSAGRRWLTVLLRAFAVSAVVVALAGPYVTRQSHEQFVVAALDESQSIAPATRQKAIAWLAEASHAAGKQRLVCLPFAEQPGAICDKVPENRGENGGWQTNIASALWAAQAGLSADYVPQIVLLSDGNENAGNARAAAAGLGVPVSVVPLEGMLTPEVFVTDLIVREPARQRWAHEVAVMVQASGDAQGEVVLSADGQELARQAVQVHAGENRVVVPVVFAKKGEVLLAAKLEGFPDSEPRNNVWSKSLIVEPEPRVLVAENPPGSTRRLAAALRKAELEVDVRSAPTAAAMLENTANYGVVILANVPTAAPHEPWMDRLAQGVRAGQGLIVIGGDQAFTPGGYTGSAIEDLLPVRAVVKDQPQDADLAMVVLIDCSESMEGPRITLAREATRRVVDHLRPGDQLGLLAYEDASTWIVPLGPCNDKARAMKQVDKLKAIGRTNMQPAMERAWLALRECFAAHKHMIVLTDGVSHMGDFRGVAQQIAASGITVSTVAVGEEPARPVLQEIAQLGKGHFYDCPDAAAVPHAFDLEALGAGHRGITEGSALVAPAGPAALPADWHLEGVPALLGYCQTSPKPNAQVLLALNSGDPLLAWQRVGQGRCAAFTSDVRPEWAAAWLQWPGFDDFWARLVRQVMPPLVEKTGLPHEQHLENYQAELRLKPTNQPLLRAIAQATGGRYDPQPADIFAPSDRSVMRNMLLASYLLAAAILLWFVEIAVRRTA